MRLWPEGDRTEDQPKVRVDDERKIAVVPLIGKWNPRPDAVSVEKVEKQMGSQADRTGQQEYRKVAFLFSLL